jgi:hypothetical protein
MLTLVLVRGMVLTIVPAARALNYAANASQASTAAALDFLMMMRLHV